MILSVPETFSIDWMKSWLPATLDIKREPEKEIDRIYLDTFDWRLFRNNSAIELASSGPGFLMTWRELDSGRIIANRVVKRVPQAAFDFISPVLKEKLNDILGGRTLITQVSVSSSTREIVLLNSEEKSVARVSLRNDHLKVAESSKNRQLPGAVYLFPYRGYEDEYDETARSLISHGRLQSIDADPLIAALDALGIVPGEYCNRPSFTLRAGQPALGEFKTILSRFLQIMEKNSQGASRGDDPEFLHDFLVVTRRTYCLLDQYPSVFPKMESRRFKQDFEWIERIAEPIRELDTYLSLFKDFGSRVDSAHREALNPLYRFLRNQKKSGQHELKIALESPRYLRFMELWHRFIEGEKALEDLLPEAKRPIIELANRGILDLYQKLLKTGKTITLGTSADSLDELHKISKLLGYEIELFTSLYQKKRITPLINTQQNMQKYLDRFHDLNLQHKALLASREKMKREQRTMPVWLEAIDLLAADLAKENKKVQKKVAKQFYRFSRKKIRKQFRDCFANE